MTGPGPILLKAVPRRSRIVSEILFRLAVPVIVTSFLLFVIGAVFVSQGFPGRALLWFVFGLIAFGLAIWFGRWSYVSVRDTAVGLEISKSGVTLAGSFYGPDRLQIRVFHGIPVIRNHSANITVGGVMYEVLPADRLWPRHYWAVPPWSNESFSAVARALEMLDVEHMRQERP